MPLHSSLGKKSKTPSQKKKVKLNLKTSQVQWLTPVIPALERQRQAVHEVKRSRPFLVKDVEWDGGQIITEYIIYLIKGL